MLAVDIQMIKRRTKDLDCYVVMSSQFVLPARSRFFWNFTLFFRKNDQKGGFFRKLKTFTNVKEYFDEKTCIKLSY